MTTTAAERFWSKVRPAAWDECWEWTASLNTYGYGQFTDSTRRAGPLGAHRWAYEHMRGEIPAGLQIDHLCSNRACVNPEHLEPVTARVNNLRAPLGLGAINAAKTSCHREHAFTPENTYITSKGKRQCRACCRLADRDYYYRRLAVAS